MDIQFMNSRGMIESGRRQETVVRGLLDSGLRVSKASRLIWFHADATAEKRASMRFFCFSGHPCPEIADYLGMLKKP